MHETVKKRGPAQSQIKNLRFVHHLALQHPDSLFFRPSLSTPRLSRLSSLPGRFLYENPPIGSQAPLSDTIHCTRADMKSVLTSAAQLFYFSSAAEAGIAKRDADPVTKLKWERSREALILMSLSSLCLGLTFSQGAPPSHIRWECGLRNAAVGTNWTASHFLTCMDFIF